jgi:Lon protease-like protein
MSDHETIRVNFGRPHPVFPLSGVTLLPHAVAALFIFEARYRQMVEDVLDTTGQIAMAAYDEAAAGSESKVSLPIRSVVCLGQIVQHERHEDGTYHILLQGICRARIAEELLPEDDPQSGKLYRRAILEPLHDEDEGMEMLDSRREEITELLESERLAGLPAVQQVRKQLSMGYEVLPTPVLMDIVALSLLTVVDEHELRNKLLEEPNAGRRADLMIAELKRIDATLRIAELQFDPEAPKGISWN